MTIPTVALAAVAVTALAIHIICVIVAIRRCRTPSGPLAPPSTAPMVSVIRPVCGYENHLEQTLRSSFALDYPRYELVFCAASSDDTALPTVKRLIAAHPHVTARILIGDDRINDNPKLNNVYKGWPASEAPWVVMADSNVLMPPDYLQRLLAVWRPDTGLVCSPPIGGAPRGFWAELECAFLNTYEARWQYVADGIGLGFAQGKSMLFRRAYLESWGGIRALATELAEDAAATKLVRADGLRVRLVNAPFVQPLGRRNAADVWGRQVRWARLRRAAFPGYFSLEVFTSGAVLMLAAALAGAAADIALEVALAFAAVWYGGEALLSWMAGWHLTARSLLACMLRDLLLPVLWLAGWIGTQFVWRGNQMRTAEQRTV